MNYQLLYDGYMDVLESSLSHLFDIQPNIPAMLKESMAYSVLNGGKRLRGVLILAGCQMLGVAQKKAVPYACAVEMIHSYSLIHDDLPCMDDDTLRRGLPCNHIRFGEANALLAGDGLLNMAYELLLEQAENMADMHAIRALASGAGVTGMIKGQSLDINAEGKSQDAEQLKLMHKCKTGALITSAVLIPAYLANLEEDGRQALKDYGNALGMAFQITDDILDEVATSQELGKTAGKDKEAGKLTYVSLYGLEGARQLAAEQVETALKALKELSYPTDFLAITAQKLLHRKK